MNYFKYGSIFVSIACLGAAVLCGVGVVSDFQDKRWGFMALNIVLIFANIWAGRLNLKNYLEIRHREQSN